MMYIFRLLGDMSHLAAGVLLIFKIHSMKSCAGVSLKTQELYALVFATRYLDIFIYFISLYNSVMKIFFFGSSLSIVWYIRHHKIVHKSYDKHLDTFRHYFLLLPCFLLALVTNERFTFLEVMWTFSVYLEAIGILPQLVLVRRTRNNDNLIGQYVFLLGAYKAFYVLNWIYRYFAERHFVLWISLISGIIQVSLYAGFFYYYFRRTAMTDKLVFETESESLVLPSSVDLESGIRSISDSCGCPMPCPGGEGCQGCQFNAASSGDIEHKQCSCGSHCGCNPCGCSDAVSGGSTKAFCKCGDSCTCATCASEI
ncbi:ER lumen protein-retaining receptor [Daucus carota subsp. sativus]|uniref:ER lumen protein-retaining receptor n=1 Tax=Daucus carota subsp. sativus TaxID=79200 RepID=UPI0007F011F5|nr:PREDICTED: ER lumen protein-retaining receptor-like [Daucus carota subsp. sativus]